MPRGGMSPAAVAMYTAGIRVQEIAAYIGQSSAYVSLQLSGQRRLTPKLKGALSFAGLRHVIDLIPEYER